LILHLYSFHKRTGQSYIPVNHSTPQTPTPNEQAHNSDPFSVSPSVLGANLSRVSIASHLSTPNALRHEKRLFSSVGNVDPLLQRKESDHGTVRFQSVSPDTLMDKENVEDV